MNQDHDAVQVVAIFIGCGAVILFAALLGIGIGWLISMVIQ